MKKYFLTRSGFLFVFFSLLGSFVAISLSLFISIITNYFSSQSRMTTAAMIAITLLYLFICICYFIGESYSRIRFISTLSETMRSDIVSHLFQKSKRDLNSSSSSFYANIIMNDVQFLTENYFVVWVSIISAFTQAILGLALIGKQSQILMIAIIPITLLGLLTSKLSNQNIADLNEKQYHQQAALVRSTTETFNNYPLVVEKAAKTPVSLLVMQHIQKYRFAFQAAQNSLSFALANLNAANYIGTILVIVVMGIFVRIGHLSFDQFVSLSFLASNIVSPVFFISSLLKKIESTKDIKSKISNLLKMSPDPSSLNKLTEEITEVSFNNVTITNDKKVIVEGFTHTFKKGKKYLILGESGSGKSSLFKALNKELTIAAGQLRINNQLIQDIDENVLASRLFFQQQNPSFFDDTVINNISIYQNISSERISSLTTKLHITKKSDNTAAVLKKNINELSGGERQRVALARSFTRDYSIHIFDEVTANLDRKTAIAVEKQLLSLTETIVINIAHKVHLPYLSRYDEIILLKEGKLVASGNWQSIQGNDLLEDLIDVK